MLRCVVIGIGNEGQLRTIALNAKALISLMALGALFLKVTPCSCSTQCLSALPSPLQLFFNAPSTFLHRSFFLSLRLGGGAADVPSCACGWCTRERPRRRWRSGQPCRSSWWRSTFLQIDRTSLEGYKIRNSIFSRGFCSLEMGWSDVVCGGRGEVVRESANQDEKMRP